MESNYGGYGTEESSSVWFDYKATQTVDDKKVPYAKLTRWDKDAQTKAEYNYISGALAGLTVRENKGNETHNIDPYAEMIVTLEAVVDGTRKCLKLPLRASGVAAYSLVRRLAVLEPGEYVKINAKVIDGDPTIWVQRVAVGGGDVDKIEPIEGLKFQDASKLTGAKATAARAANAEARELFVEGVVTGHPCYHAPDAAAATHVAEEPAPKPVPTSPVAEDEYDPFADE